MKIHHSIALRVIALTLLAGCGGDSGSTASSVATDAGASSAPVSTVTMQPTPPLIPLVLPSKPIPTGGHLPITAPANSTGQREVKGGEIAQTACFKVVIPYNGIAQGAGCAVYLATAQLGSGAGPDVPYFKAQALSDPSANLDALQQELLDGLAKNDAQVAASGLPYQREELARRGKLGTDQGSYLGSRNGTIFGRPARILTWGFTQGEHQMEYVDAIAMLPAGRYVWSGKPLTALLIQGYTSGYQPKLFAYALSHIEMR